MLLRETIKYLWHMTPWTSYFEQHLILRNMLDRHSDLTLDAGCGKWGSAARILIRNGRKVIGVDVEKEIDRKLLRNKNFNYVVANIENLPFKDYCFDQIACIAVLEHVAQDKLAAEELKRILKPGGKLLLITTSSFWRFPYYRFMQPLVPKEEELLNSFGHIRKGYSIGEITSLFKGFKPIQTKYFINKVSALGYDIQHAKSKFIKYVVLRVLAIPLLLNAIAGAKGLGTHIAVKLAKY